MNTQTVGILALLRASLTGNAAALPEGFDWGSASGVLYEHHLTGLAIQGALRCGIPRNDPHMLNLTALFCKEIAVSRIQIQLLGKIFAAFEENNVEYLPIKGTVLKALYPRPELRKMGDADILIRTAQYPTIRKLLAQLGLQEVCVNEIEYVWKQGDFTLELHKQLIPYDHKDYGSYYGDGWHLAKRCQGSSAYCLTPEDHYLFLLVHFAKHYRIGTICAKGIVDFRIWRQKHPDMDETYIREELKKLHLLTFHQNMMALLDTWFEGADPTEAVALITETAFRGGIQQEDNSGHSFHLTQTNTGGKSPFLAKCRWLLDRIFPSFQYMASCYPVLRKCPVLLPAAWVYRWLRGVLFRRDLVVNTLKAARLYLTPGSSALREYEEALKAVGLRDPQGP